MEDCYGVIFSHDFAKAFWKNDFWAGHISTPVGDNDNGLGMRMSHSWQYHLQQMVLQENPINYLRKFPPGVRRIHIRTDTFVPNVRKVEQEERQHCLGVSCVNREYRRNRLVEWIVWRKSPV